MEMRQQQLLTNFQCIPSSLLMVTVVNKSIPVVPLTSPLEKVTCRGMLPQENVHFQVISSANL